MVKLACVVAAIVNLQLLLSQELLDSPCPEWFTYETNKDDQQNDRWFGTLSLRTKEELHGVWIRVILDRRAELLGNWFGESSTKDNMEFTIKNPGYSLAPGPPVAVKFFVKFEPNQTPPRVRMIRLNGRTICGDAAIAPPPDFNTLHISRPASDRNKNNNNGQSEPQMTNNRPVQTGNRPASTNTPTENRPTSNTMRPQTPSNNGNRPSSTGSVNNGNRPSTNNNNNNGNRPSNSRPNENRPSNNDRVENRPPSQPPQMRPSGQNNRPMEPSIMSNFVGTVGQGNSNNNERDNDNDNTFRPTSTTNRRPEISLNNNEEEFFPGDFNPSRRPIVTTLIENTNDNICGIVAQQPRPLITYGKETSEGQWPWHAALYRSKGTDLQYICGGSLISRRHVLTAAHCVTKLQTNRAISPDLLQIYLGKYSLRKLNTGVQSMIVERILVHPEYNATVFHNDIAILKLTQTATITDYVRPVCLWEEEVGLNSVIERLGTVVGWGYDSTGALTENLMQAQMPVVTTETCIFSNREFFSRFTSSKTYCAGFRNGTSACTGDSGGGMFFPKTGSDSRNKVWQIRGVVSLSAALQTGNTICDTSNYIIFTDIAKYLSWIRDIVERR